MNQELFISRAKENLEAAILLFDNELFNACANRAYYAAFHLAIASILSVGITPTIDHKTVQTLFSENFFNRRKVLPSKFKEYLSDLQIIRNIADYKDGISKARAKIQLNMAKDFFIIINERKII